MSSLSYFVSVSAERGSVVRWKLKGLVKMGEDHLFVL